MSPIARGWVGCASVGAGLLHVALALGRPLELAAALFAIGIVEFGWGAITLAEERALAPRIALFAALTPGILWAVALFAGVRLPFLPLATSTLLELFVAVMIAISIRRVDVAVAPSTRRLVLSLTLAVLTVAAVTLPALTLTQAEAPPAPLPTPEHGHR
jgi:hypothetical protein